MVYCSPHLVMATTLIVCNRLLPVAIGVYRFLIVCHATLMLGKEKVVGKLTLNITIWTALRRGIKTSDTFLLKIKYCLACV